MSNEVVEVETVEDETETKATVCQCDSNSFRSQKQFRDVNRSLQDVNKNNACRKLNVDTP